MVTNRNSFTNLRLLLVNRESVTALAWIAFGIIGAVISTLTFSGLFAGILALTFVASSLIQIGAFAYFAPARLRLLRATPPTPFTFDLSPHFKRFARHVRLVAAVLVAVALSIAPLGGTYALLVGACLWLTVRLANDTRHIISQGRAERSVIRAEIGQIYRRMALDELETAAIVAGLEANTAQINRETALLEIEKAANRAWQED